MQTPCSIHSFLGTGSSVNILTEWLLPDVKKYEGIVINLSEMRLYVFSPKGRVSSVSTFPIGIGSEGNETPLGYFNVIEKILKPHWHVPESIRKERPELPEVVPPGSDNPLGSPQHCGSRQTLYLSMAPTSLGASAGG